MERWETTRSLSVSNMPKGLDDLRKSIWNGLKGKINPRTKKPYTESDAWGIATSQWKKSGKGLSVSIDEDVDSESEILSKIINNSSGDNSNE